MKTQIYKTYSDFLNRENKIENGVSKSFSELNPDFEKQNLENESCWNCSRCSDCSDCSGCSGCSRCSGCSGCSRCSRCSDCSGCSRCSGCSDCSRCSGCSGLKNAAPVEQTDVKKYEYPTIENIHTEVLKAVSSPGSFDMGSWHQGEQINDEGAHCGTTHCRAGWVVALAGKEGRELEQRTSTLHAAMQIYHKSSPDINVSPVRFFESNEIALADIKRCAELEQIAKNQ